MVHGTCYMNGYDCYYHSTSQRQFRHKTIGIAMHGPSTLLLSVVVGIKMLNIQFVKQNIVAWGPSINMNI